MIPVKSQTRTLAIHNVDENILTARYFSRCLEYGCRDCCCGYGCPVDLTEVERIMAFRDELEKRLGRKAEEWFLAPEANTDYPSGYVRRTVVYNGLCVFHDWSARGCLLHSFALEKHFDPHSIKPMVCFMFPLTWDGDYLHVAEFLDELPCRQQGEPILETTRSEIRYYLGEALASEIDAMKHHPLPSAV
jgi:Fe-S-cluster containining protein